MRGTRDHNRYAREYLKTLKEFQAQVWWVGDTNYSSIDTSNAKIVDAYIMANADETPASSEATDTTESTQYGDIDGSGEVDILDVIMLNKNILGITKLSDTAKKNADVNIDGKIDSADSITILKFLVELIEALPA